MACEKGLRWPSSSSDAGTSAASPGFNELSGRFRCCSQFKYALFAGVLLALSPNALADTPADTLVIAKNIDDIITLDPAEAYELTGIEVVANIYDRIMRFEPTDINKLVPGVAESYTVSDDGKTFTFKIRPGQKFASGNPMTAADAAFSLQRVVKLDKTPAFLIGQLGWTKDNVDQLVKAVDDQTFSDHHHRGFLALARPQPDVVGRRLGRRHEDRHGARS